MTYSRLLALAELPELNSAHIEIIQTDNPTRIRLLGMGLGKGSRVEVLRNRRGDLVLSNGNNRISLGRSITQQIFVQVQA
ncbi:ferrous iron transport protein A [uncultured Thiothrix sp.]|uniref:FeoA family protein n=1 Tax=uncultured Thiothrix sp. TaxID=223185 RepID=UPI0026368A8C|nr:ferrous iron transport protein A [uncultured Thiothrix sp.]